MTRHDGTRRDRLPDDQKDGGDGIGVTVMSREVVQPAAQQMKHEKEVSDHKNRIDSQLDQKGLKGTGGSFFHGRSLVSPDNRVWQPTRSGAGDNRGEFRCAGGISY